jgi:hypothetical protein
MNIRNFQRELKTMTNEELLQRFQLLMLNAIWDISVEVQKTEVMLEMTEAEILNRMNMLDILFNKEK